MEKLLHTNVCKETVYAKIHKSLAKDLHDFVYYKFGASFSPEDKVQEAFIKLWNNCKKVPPEKAKSFLFTIVNNLSLNEAKHNKVVLKYNALPQKNHTTISPQFILEEKEYLDKYEKALYALPEGQREAFLLNRVEGKKHQEIAALIGISKKAVEKRLYTALNTLRKDIEGL